MGAWERGSSRYTVVMDIEDKKPAKSDSPVFASTRHPKRRGAATDAAYERLLQMARELGPDKPLPPVRQLLEQLQVSRATVDAALARLERQRIVLRREREGVFVAPQRSTSNITVICSPDYFLTSAVSPVWSLLLDQFHLLASESGIQLKIAFTDVLTPEQRGAEPDEEATHLPEWLANEVRSGRIDGAVCIGQTHAVSRWIEAHNVPVVAFAGPAGIIVSSALQPLFDLGVKALAERGCRRVWVITFPEDEWWEGYNLFVEETLGRSIAAHRLPFQTYIRLPLRSGNRARSRPELGWDHTIALYGAGSDPDARPDGIVSVDDMMTQGVLMAMQHLGVRVGQDVQVATHANKGSSVLRAWHDDLYRIEYDLAEVVRLMFETLDLLMTAGLETALQRLTFARPEEIFCNDQEHHLLIYPRLIPPRISTE